MNFTKYFGTLIGRISTSSSVSKTAFSNRLMHNVFHKNVAAKLTFLTP